MKERQTDLVLWYTSSDTLYVYEIEEFVWEWKAFEAVRVKDESGIRTGWVDLQICLDPAYSVEEILVSGETDKVRVERYDIKTCKWSALLKRSSLDRTDRRLGSLSSTWQLRSPTRHPRSLDPIFS